MSDEELIHHLQLADTVLREREFHPDGPIRRSVAEAIRRIAPAEPDPDSVLVKIAVSVGADGRAEVVQVEQGDYHDVLVQLDEEISEFSTVTHEAIITASIPRRVVPVVEAEVIPCD